MFASHWLPAPRALKTGFIAALGAFLFNSPLVSGETVTVSMDPGVIETSDGAVPEGDMLMAVFSDAFYPDPFDVHNAAAAAKRAGLIPLEGCLSVARLQLGSQTPRLSGNGTLTFSCHDVPADAQVLAWVNQQWQPILFDRTANNQISVSIQALTTYVIVPTPTANRPGAI